MADEPVKPIDNSRKFVQPAAAIRVNGQYVEPSKAQAKLDAKRNPKNQTDK